MKCAKCGKPATKYNKNQIPVCGKCANAKITPPTCPNCKLEMVIRQGKYGAFWGCPAFPMCDGISKI